EAVYVSQFPVLQAYEHQMMFDRRGRQLCGDWHQYGLLQAELEEEAKRQKPPGWVSLWKRVEAYTRGEREVDVSPFEPPFVRADRVESMTSAYRAFAHRYGLASESSWRSS